MTAINVLDRVRLDVERDLATGELVNLIQNPSGDLGGWGWITPVASTAMSGGTELAYAASPRSRTGSPASSRRSRQATT